VVRVAIMDQPRLWEQSHWNLLTFQSGATSSGPVHNSRTAIKLPHGPRAMATARGNGDEGLGDTVMATVYPGSRDMKSVEDSDY